MDKIFILLSIVIIFLMVLINHIKITKNYADTKNITSYKKKYLKSINFSISIKGLFIIFLFAIIFILFHQRFI